MILKWRRGSWYALFKCSLEGACEAVADWLHAKICDTNQSAILSLFSYDECAPNPIIDDLMTCMRADR